MKPQLTFICKYNNTIKGLELNVFLEEELHWYTLFWQGEPPFVDQEAHTTVWASSNPAVSSFGIGGPLLCCWVAPIFCEYLSSIFFSRASIDFWSANYMAIILLESATTSEIMSFEINKYLQWHIVSYTCSTRPQTFISKLKFECHIDLEKKQSHWQKIWSLQTRGLEMCRFYLLIEFSPPSRQG